MSGTTVDIVKLIQFNWEYLSAEEQQKILDRSRDLIMLSLDTALEGAVAPQETPQTQSAPVAAFPAPGGSSPQRAPSPGEIVGTARVTAADVPFGGPDNYPDYSYDDFAKLAEDHGVPPVAAIGHWFGKSLGIKFDQSTPEIRRKVYAEMKAVYDSAQGPVAPSGVGAPPMAAVQAPYVQPNLQVCPQCGQPAKFVQGGVSKKTGKPYNGFWSCDRKPQCTTFYYNGENKGQTWTVERDWTAAYNRAHVPA